MSLFPSAGGGRGKMLFAWNGKLHAKEPRNTGRWFDQARFLARAMRLLDEKTDPDRGHVHQKDTKDTKVEIKGFYWGAVQLQETS
jgi:hypothetical protein